MAPIQIEAGVPGIRGPKVFSTKTTKPMRECLRVTPRGPQSTLLKLTSA